MLRNRSSRTIHRLLRCFNGWSSSKPAAEREYQLDIMELESRVLYDAAPIDIAAFTAYDAPHADGDFSVLMDLAEKLAAAEAHPASDNFSDWWKNHDLSESQETLLSKLTASNLDFSQIQLPFAGTDAESTWQSLENLLTEFNSDDVGLLTHADDQTAESEYAPFIVSDYQPESLSGQSQELVLIDRSVENYQQLVDDILANASEQRHISVVYLDEYQDGVGQITDAITGYYDLDAIHIISHASQGQMQLGNTYLNLNSLGGYQDQIAAWRSALSQNADLLFYGCDLAGSESGIELIDTLSRLTGADIAASNDVTGHGQYGGNWHFEYSTGLIETRLAFSTDIQHHWDGQLATFTVTSTLGDASAGTLRWAIQQANTNAGADTINFNLGAGIKRISPTSQMTITEAVLIDGWSKADFAGVPLIEIKGDNAGGSSNGFVINANNVEIRGLIINRFNGGDGIDVNGNNNLIRGNYIGTNDTGTSGGVGNGGHGIHVKGANNTIGGTGANDRNVISANAGHGIFIDGEPADGNTILGNYIGVNKTGTAALGNGGDGINITGGDANTIGGNTAAARNIISGNSNDGILLNNGATLNTIIGNYIGTNKDGASAIANGWEGIEIISSSSNTIGGTTSAQRNVISGNDYDGIGIIGSNSFNNVVQGNYIGISADGTQDLGNYYNGVWIAQGAHHNTVGGSVAGAGNVISGNEDEGVEIQGSTTTANSILGNIIGLNPTGTVVIGNGDGISVQNDAGVLIEGAPGNFIGGTLATERNIISGNKGSGILIVGTNATGNQIFNNYVGVMADGVTAAGNTNHGILIANSAEGTTGNPSQNIIGGIAAGQGNLIANNTGDGVSVQVGNRNAIRGNRFLNNTGLAIDLNDDGVSNNDAGDVDGGANQTQNFAVLTTASTNFDDVKVSGSLDAGVASANYQLDFYWTVANDPSGHGEAENYVGSAQVTTNGSGIANFNVTLPGNVPAGARLTAIATDALGNTSEFSLNINVAERLNIDLPAPQLNWDTGDGKVFIDTGAIVNDPASVPWNLGNLTAQFTVNGTTVDQLSIYAPGTVGNLSINSGTNLRYHTGGSPITFGTIDSSGANGTQLIVTFNASATTQMIQTLLRSIQFENTQATPPDTIKTVQFLLTDGGGGTSNFETEQIRVGPANDPPAVTIANPSITYTENDPPLVIHSALTVVDSDSPTLAGATVAITGGFSAGQDQLRWDNAIAIARGISVSYNATTGVLTLSGARSDADYQAVLRTVKYENISENPSTADRVITFNVDDGFDIGSDSRTVKVIAVNDRPVIDLDENDSVKPGLNYETTYTAGGSAVNITDIDAVLFDVDNATIQNLTVTIKAPGFVTGQDQLLYDTTLAGSMGLASHGYNASTGVLSFVGNASISNYQSLLRSIKYNNTAPNPNTTNTRMIEFVAYDGGTSSLTATSEVYISKGLGLLLTTSGTVLPGTGTPSLLGWDDEDIIELGDPNLKFEPAGDSGGTMSLFADTTPFWTKQTNSLHFVSRDMTLGTGARTVNLLYGDILFSLKSPATISGLSVGSEDIVRYRSSDSSFAVIAQNASGDNRGVSAMTLVEQDTVVGDVTLKAGSFLVVKSSTGGEKNDIFYFRPTGLGAGLASGSWDKLIEGDEVGVTEAIQGLDLVESDTNMGGMTLRSGWLLMSVENPTAGIGDVGPSISVQPQDIFYLEMTSTTLGSPNANGRAVRLLDGFDPVTPNTKVFLDTAPEAISGISLQLTKSSPHVPQVASNSAPTDIGPNSFAVYENVDTTGGYNLGILTATDSDAGESFSFSIRPGADAALFSIGGAGNELIFDNGALNFEARSTYTVNVRVTDSAGNNHDELLTVNVTDISVTIDVGQSFNAGESAGNGTAVGTLITSGDAATTFNIIGGNTGSAFAINNSGQITINNASAIDFETSSSFSLTVQVGDGSTTTNETVVINVTDVAATINAGQSFNVNELAGNGTAVGTLTTSGDAAATFNITSGNTGNAFAINNSGQITVNDANAIDFESGGSFSLTVQVGDGTTTTSQTVVINVMDANVTVNAGQSFNVSEAAGNGTPVGTLATSGDVASTFNIIGGNTGSAFAINSSGQIAVNNASAIDYESSTSFSLTVQVSDGTTITNETVVINVNDVNEAPTDLLLSNNVVMDRTDTSSGYSVGSLSSVDEDSPESFTYLVTGGADSIHFSIGGAGLNQLIMNDGTLNAILQASYEVIVQTTDSAGNSIDRTFNVIVPSPINTLWFSTFTDVSGSGIPELANFSSNEMIQFGNPNLTFGASTSGYFTSVLNLMNFVDPVTTSAHIDGLHHLTRAVTVNGIKLAAGDILLSTDTSVQIAGTTYTRDDLFVFQLTTPGDLSAGTFRMVYDGLAQNNLRDFAIVEKDIMVGDANLSAGTILYTQYGGSFAEEDVLRRNPGQGFSTVFVDGSDIGLAGNTLRGIELVHDNIIVGGYALNAGDLLLTTGIAQPNDVVGDNNLFVERYDVFGLKLSTTGNSTSGNAFMFLDGSDVNLNQVDETIYPITLRLATINSTPNDISINTSSVNENTNTSSGYTVGTLSANDPDPTESFTYAVVGGADAAKFTIGGAGSNQLVLTDGLLNYEAQSSYSVDIRVTDSASNTYIETLTINVNDVAVTINAGQTFNVGELAGNGTAVGTLATSGDAASTFNIMAGNTGNAFAISNSGQITINNASSIDFESGSSFSLTVQVGDGTTTTSQTVVINVTDANVTVNAGQSFNVSEAAGNGTPVGALATSGDASSTFSIIGGNTGSAFAISNSGQITTNNASAIDYESSTSFSLTVQVSDGTTVTSETVLINVTDANVTIDAGQSFNVNELTSNGTVLGMLSVNGDPATSFNIIGGNTGSAFAISNSGQITINNASAIDFESASSFSLTVQASDGTTVTSETVVINVTDVAATINAGQSFNAGELAGNGTAVGTLITSGDAASTFTIVGGNTGSAFAIDNIGQITINDASAIDYESGSSFSLTVQVGDGTTTTTETVVINVTDVAATINTGQSFNINELAGNGTTVGTLTTSGDASSTFNLIGGNTGNAFAINNSGQITVNDTSAIDFESGTSFSLTVQVSDGTSTTNETVVINVLDANVTVNADQSFNVSESAGNGTPLGTLATGGDASATFNIIGGNTGSAFAIDNSGQITINNASAIDFESSTSFSLTVQVSDGTTTTNETVLINVTDANVTITAGQSFNVSEAAGNGTLLGTLATSGDASATFNIIGGNTGSAFAINNSGQITVNNASAIDFGSATSFSLTVQVSDGTTTTSETVVISINDMNEAPTVADQLFNVDENVADGTFVGKVLASDPDAGDLLSYTIIAGDPSGVFAIDGAGNITVKDGSQLNYEATLLYNLTVQVTDSGSPGLTDTAKVKINIGDVNESPIAKNDSFSVNSGDSLNKRGSALLGNDSDPENQPLTVILVDNVAHGTLTLLPDGSFTYIPDKGFDGTDSFTYIINDGVNSSQTARVLIEVNEVITVGPPATPADQKDDVKELPPVAPPIPNLSKSLTETLIDAIPENVQTNSGLYNIPVKNSDPEPVQIGNQSDNLEFDLFSLVNRTDRIDVLQLTSSNIVLSGNTIVSDELLYLANSDLWHELDAMSKDLNFSPLLQQIVINSIAGFSGALTVGYVLWIIRGGYLMASVLSSLPAWRFVDPLPILDFLDDADEDKESIQSILETSNAK